MAWKQLHHHPKGKSWDVAQVLHQREWQHQPGESALVVLHLELQHEEGEVQEMVADVEIQDMLLRG